MVALGTPLKWQVGRLPNDVVQEPRVPRSALPRAQPRRGGLRGLHMVGSSSRFLQVISSRMSSVPQGKSWDAVRKGCALRWVMFSVLSRLMTIETAGQRSLPASAVRAEGLWGIHSPNSMGDPCFTARIKILRVS